MITDPRIGDVVYFVEAAGWSDYFDTSPSVRYQISAFPAPYSPRDGENIPVLLINLQSGEGPRRELQNDTGVWTRWLARDEFLSQAYHAQKESEEEHAPRTTENSAA